MESIEEWLTCVSSADYKVWVENPETIKESGFMGKTYTTFRVVLKSPNTHLMTIRHRFSEFCTLRDILKVEALFVHSSIMLLSLIKGAIYPLWNIGAFAPSEESHGCLREGFHH
jgi:hypothetical protein